MTDRPIPFSPPMIRALLKGRKTQTRRGLKQQPGELDRPFWMDDGSWHVADSQGGHMSPLAVRYAPGDRLWVREAWRSIIGYDDRPPRDIPPGTPIHYEDGAERDPTWKWGRYRHGRFMPRWASRLTLIVTDVRVERLQDISHDDAEAEGVLAHVAPHSLDNVFRSARGETAVQYFADIWNRLHGPDAWDENPWVAAVTFDVFTTNIDAFRRRR